mgnify:CR=1 FL=1
MQPVVVAAIERLEGGELAARYPDHQGHVARHWSIAADPAVPVVGR